MSARSLASLALTLTLLLGTGGCGWFSDSPPKPPAPPGRATAEGGKGGPETDEQADVPGEEVVEAQGLFKYEIPPDYAGYGDVPFVRVGTPDGWNLAVYHYAPPGEFAKVFPVILVHGEGFNRFIWDFDENHSLARALANDIFDVWVVELRGHGHSSIEEAAPSPTAEWIFEDYARDVNAVIDYVTAQTGASQVMLVGHSTGGTLVYGLMGNPVYSRKIAAGVTLAAPTLFRFPNDTLTSLFIHRDKAFEEEYVDLRRGMYLPAPFEENVETIYSILFFNDFHLDPNLVERFGDLGFEKVRSDILRQFGDWFAEEKAYSTEDTSFNYHDDLNLIRAPVCAFVGWRDTIAQPENVLEATELIEDRLLTLRMFGKANGHQDYYGHLGLLLNQYARVDVYPEVLNCLNDILLKVEQGAYAEGYQTPKMQVDEPYPDDLPSMAPVGNEPVESEPQPPLTRQPEGPQDGEFGEEPAGEQPTEEQPPAEPAEEEPAGQPEPPTFDQPEKSVEAGSSMEDAGAPQPAE